jgi:putative NADH-flavin reductase
MNIAILGATGGTGLELVRRCLESGHSVTAFARKPDSLTKFRGRIKVVTGNLLNACELTSVLHGQDAVLSGFGPRVPIAKTDAHLLRDFATTLVTSMKEASLRRAIIISTAFLFKDSVIPPTYLIGKLLFPSVLKDATEMEAIIRGSGFEWTIVRPPQLTDFPFTGHYRERIDHLPPFGFKISRADVAHYFVKNLNEKGVIRQVVGISN